MSEVKPDSMQETVNWYNKNAETYANAAAGRASINQITDFVSMLPHGAKVLDAGCGSGRDTNLFRQSGFSAVGLDLSTELIKDARKRFPNEEFVEGNLLQLPFPDESFDGTWAHASLLHLDTEDDMRKALSEFHRVLKTNGVLHVLVKAQTGSEKTAVVEDTVVGHKRFFQYFTQDELQELLTEAGFNQEMIRQYNDTEEFPDGNPNLEWILALSRKK